MLDNLYNVSKEVLQREIEMYISYCVRESYPGSSSLLRDSDMVFSNIDISLVNKTDFEHLSLCKWVYHLRGFDN